MAEIKRRSSRKKGAAKGVKRVKIAKGLKVKPEKKEQMKKRKGGSNVGEYKKVSKKEFCGPSGGAPKGSYPVNTAKRCRAALSYAHNAPNPEGIKECVRKKCKGVVKTKTKKK